MASAYGIEDADLTPGEIPDAQWLQLMDDDGDGVEDEAAEDLILRAEARMRGWLGGVLTDADNIATAKPFVIDVAVFLAHRRRANSADYKIPQAVSDAFAAAQAWAKSDGQALLSGEGGGSAGLQYTAADDDYTTDLLKDL